MGNIPASQRLPEDKVVEAIRWARENDVGAIRTLMELFDIPAYSAEYHYRKCINKGLIRSRRNEHMCRDAIMFFGTPNAVKIPMCQVCKTLWPCNHEVLRLQTVAEDAQRQVS